MADPGFNLTGDVPLWTRGRGGGGGGNW